MSTKLIGEDDLTDFFFEYYQFIKDYSKGWPVMVNFSEGVVAQYHGRSMHSSHF